MAPCRDCGTGRDIDTMYFVIPPGADDTSEDAFWLCTFCWDRLTGLATTRAAR